MPKSAWRKRFTPRNGKFRAKASKAQLEDVNGTVVYDVEVIHGNKVEDVKVDVKTGKVLDVRAHTHKIVFPDPSQQ